MTRNEKFAGAAVVFCLPLGVWAHLNGHAMLSYILVTFNAVGMSAFGMHLVSSDAEGGDKQKGKARESKGPVSFFCGLCIVVGLMFVISGFLFLDFAANSHVENPERIALSAILIILASIAAIVLAFRNRRKTALLTPFILVALSSMVVMYPWVKFMKYTFPR